LRAYLARRLNASETDTSTLEFRTKRRGVGAFAFKFSPATIQQELVGIVHNSSPPAAEEQFLYRDRRRVS